MAYRSYKDVDKLLKSNPKITPEIWLSPSIMAERGHVLLNSPLRAERYEAEELELAIDTGMKKFWIPSATKKKLTIKPNELCSLAEFEFVVDEVARIQSLKLHEDWMIRHPKYLTDLAITLLLHESDLSFTFMSELANLDPNEKVEQVYRILVRELQSFFKMHNIYLCNAKMFAKPITLAEMVKLLANQRLGLSDKERVYVTLAELNDGYKQVYDWTKNVLEVKLDKPVEAGGLKLLSRIEETIIVSQAKLSYVIERYTDGEAELGVAYLDISHGNQKFSEAHKAMKYSNNWKVEITESLDVTGFMFVPDSTVPDSSHVLRFINDRIVSMSKPDVGVFAILASDESYVKLNPNGYQTLEEFVADLNKATPDLLACLR